jgi:DNA-binding NarL/FixJ family response regulator
MSGRRILLVSPDLMVGSRLAGLVRAAGGSLEQRHAATAAAAGFDVVILDLQGLPGPAAVIAGLRVAGPDGTAPKIVAFGPHVATALLAEARAAGADAVVSRGEILGSFAAVLERVSG